MRARINRIYPSDSLSQTPPRHDPAAGFIPIDGTTTTFPKPNQLRTAAMPRQIRISIHAADQLRIHPKGSSIGPSSYQAR